MKLLSIGLCSAAATGLVGCTQEQTQGWKRPDWMRSKRGTNGNGGKSN